MPDETAGELFTGGVPEAYERLMVPFMFEPYADDLSPRVTGRHPRRVLELAAGTGVLTRRLAADLPAECEIVATDLNPTMLDLAERAGAPRPDDTEPVRWMPADAQQIPFDDESFDVVACQFGVMFFSDRVGAYREVRRTLKPGGAFVFNAWDAPAHNAVAGIVDQTVRRLLPDAGPTVIARVAHGYVDAAVIAHDLGEAGLDADPIQWVDGVGRTPSARTAVLAICRGTPLRFELEPYGADMRAAVEDAASERVAELYGDGPVLTPLRALVVTAVRH